MERYLMAHEVYLNDDVFGRLTADQIEAGNGAIWAQVSKRHAAEVRRQRALCELIVTEGVDPRTQEVTSLTFQCPAHCHGLCLHDCMRPDGLAHSILRFSPSFTVTITVVTPPLEVAMLWGHTRGYPSKHFQGIIGLGLYTHGNGDIEPILVEGHDHLGMEQDDLEGQRVELSVTLRVWRDVSSDAARRLLGPRAHNFSLSVAGPEWGAFLRQWMGGLELWSTSMQQSGRNLCKFLAHAKSGTPIVVGRLSRNAS